MRYINIRWHWHWHYAVQGHSRSPTFVPIDSPYDTNFLSCTVSKLLQIIGRSNIRCPHGVLSLTHLFRVNPTPELRTTKFDIKYIAFRSIDGAKFILLNRLSGHHRCDGRTDRRTDRMAFRNSALQRSRTRAKSQLIIIITVMITIHVYRNQCHAPSKTASTCFSSRKC